MSRVPYYPTDLPAIDAALQAAHRGAVGELGVSAGGRSIPVVSYGEPEPVQHTANLSSALAGRQPEAFFGAEARSRPVLLITAAVHGAEMESIAAVLNLIRLLETGTDLRGQEWPELVAAAEQMRVIIVPCLNPDGRARIPEDDPSRWEQEKIETYRHGLHADGTPIGWPACKVPHPRDPAQDRFLGGYFNDAGVNPLHGVLLPPEQAPETHAALALMLAEKPDLVLDLHSCGAGPFFIIGGGSLPDSYHYRQHYLNGFCRKALRDRLGIHRGWGWAGGDRSRVLDLNSAAFHVSAALPMIFEGPHGAQDEFRYGPAEIIDMYLVMLESLMTVGAHEGFRPQLVP